PYFPAAHDIAQGKARRDDRHFPLAGAHKTGDVLTALPGNGLEGDRRFPAAARRRIRRIFRCRDLFHLNAPSQSPPPAQQGDSGFFLICLIASASTAADSTTICLFSTGMKSKRRVYVASHRRLIEAAFSFPVSVRLMTCCRLLEGSVSRLRSPARHMLSTVRLSVLLSSSSREAS